MNLDEAGLVSTAEIEARMVQLKGN
jgi:hypothetical protein